MHSEKESASNFQGCAWIRFGRGPILFIALAFIGFPIASLARENDQFRDQARAIESQMRALGEPRDRCSLGANIYEGQVIARTTAASGLLPGDRLVVLNKVNLAGKTADQVISVLREILPTAQIPATVDRDGQFIDLSLQCVNSRPLIEPVVNALSFAAKGKFDECFETIGQLTEVDTRSKMLRAQCAAASSNASKYNAPEELAQAIGMAIDDARYAPGLRPGVVVQLRNLEHEITRGVGAAQFKALVAKTKSWPGGESMYEASTPDWALFRRNSENSLRSRLIDPESARIEWTHGFTLGTWKPFMSKRIEGYWTCGLINARNRMGGYTGSTAFVVVLDPAGRVQYSSVGESKDFDLLTASCNNSFKLLPAPPAELLGSPTDKSLSTSAPLSVADEIKKLVDLKNSGAISDAEFQAAKQKVLGAPSK